MQSHHQTTGGFLILAGSGLFLLGMIIAEARYPGYSVSQNMISDLGVGPTAHIFNSVTILYGLATIASIFLIRHNIRSILFLILLGLSGIGVLGVGLFPEDMGRIHDISAAMAFVFGSLGAIYSSRLLLSPFRYLSGYLGVFSMVEVVLFVMKSYHGLGPGGMERMVAYPIIIWSMGLGGALMKPFKT